MFAQRCQNRLSLQEESGLYRRPPEVRERSGKYLDLDGKKVLNFASNDYLGLADSPAFKRILVGHVHRYGTSSSSSRLVTGNHRLTGEAERALAAFFGYEEALLCPSGFQANLSLLSALFEPGDRVFIDRHLHASSLKGLALSGAEVAGFRHSDFTHLEKKLQRASAPERQAAVVTESLFSMDGDLLDCTALARLKGQYGFLTLVDEAHAFGAVGPGGRGIAGGLADVAVGTLGKAFGLFGAFLLLPKLFKEYLLNFSAPVLFTTALPFFHAAALLEILPLIGEADDLRAKLWETHRFMKTSLDEAGFRVFGDAHILGVEIGDESQALGVSQGLRQRGILAFCARYPTVPRNHAMLRIGMTALHDRNDVTLFVKTLGEVVHQNTSQ